VANVARVGDTSDHNGVIISGANRTFVNGKAVARIGDMHSCPEHGISPITSGSSSVFVEGRAVARVGDTVACGAVITSGSPDTMVG